MNRIARELSKANISVVNGAPSILYESGERLVYGENTQYPLEMAVIVLNHGLTQRVTLDAPVYSPEEAVKVVADHNLSRHSEEQRLANVLYYLLTARQRIHAQLWYVEQSVTDVVSTVRESVTDERLRKALHALRESRSEVEDPLFRPYTHFFRETAEAVVDAEALVRQISLAHASYFLDHVSEQITEMRSVLELLPGAVFEYAEYEEPPTIV